jgi:hypothetical protein
MSRTISLISVVGAALVLAVPVASGKGDGGQPQWMQALEIRSQELNRQHGLGQHDSALRALNLRSEGLNRVYELGGYSTTVNQAIEARERAFAAGRDQQPTSMLDARERAFVTKAEVRLEGVTSSGAFERAVAAHQRVTTDPVRDDRFRIDPSPGSEPVTVTDGREIEWPQVGIGFGIGMVLAIGLLLTLRATRQRPLAH